MNGDPNQTPAQETEQKPEEKKDVPQNKEGCTKTEECTKPE